MRSIFVDYMRVYSYLDRINDILWLQSVASLEYKRFNGSSDSIKYLAAVYGIISVKTMDILQHQ
jgi:hypothetical protein